MRQHRSTVLLVGLAYLTFVALGLPSGVLNVAWPSIRDSFGLAQDAIGALLAVHTLGYLLAGSSNGPLLSRLGVGRFLLASTLTMTVGLAGFALAPRWWAMVAFGVLLGLGAGAIDAVLNTYFAANHGASLMNWLHACFGLGAAVGPQLVVTVPGRGHSWRWSYAIVCVCEALLATGFILTVQQWQLGHASLPASGKPRRMRTLDTLKLPAVWLGILLFVSFTGIEGSAGQWAYPLFTEARQVAPAAAGLWVSVYWASLTAGRVIFGIAASRIPVATLLRAGMAGTACGAVLIWWNPVQLLSFLGLALMGFSLAPLFPLSISHTPVRVGDEHSANAIGYEVAGASIGIAALPSFVGVLAARAGLETLGPFLLVASVLVFFVHEASMRFHRRRHAVPGCGDGPKAKPLA